MVGYERAQFVGIVRSGRLEDGTRYVLIKVETANISKRRFFNYANALTVRAVELVSNGANEFDIDELGAFITDQNNRQRPWVYERTFMRERERVLAYSQFMSQGYTFQPSETFSSLMTVAIPEKVEVIDISARFTYGASNSLWSPDKKISGGLAIDRNQSLAACATRLEDKRKYETPCEQNWTDDFVVRSAYAESSFVLKDQKEEGSDQG